MQYTLAAGYGFIPGRIIEERATDSEPMQLLQTGFGLALGTYRKIHQRQSIWVGRAGLLNSTI